MSEQHHTQNIEKNTRNVPQSAIGQQDNVMDKQNGFEKESDLERVSNFAVLRQKIPLTNTNKHIQAFKTMYDQMFSGAYMSLIICQTIPQSGPSETAIATRT